jgi:hypothetical protein
VYKMFKKYVIKKKAPNEMMEKGKFLLEISF